FAREQLAAAHWKMGDLERARKLPSDCRQPDQSPLSHDERVDETSGALADRRRPYRVRTQSEAGGEPRRRGELKRCVRCEEGGRRVSHGHLDRTTLEKSHT